MEQMLDDIILLDEDGQEGHFAHVLTFLYEGGRYIALEPIEEGGDYDEEEAEIVLFRIVSDEEGDVYEPIDNEILLQEVFDEFLSLMEEQEEE